MDHYWKSDDLTFSSGGKTWAEAAENLVCYTFSKQAGHSSQNRNRLLRPIKKAAMQMLHFLTLTATGSLTCMYVLAGMMTIYLMIHYCRTGFI